MKETELVNENFSWAQRSSLSWLCRVELLYTGHWQETEIDGCHSIFSLLNDTHTLGTWHTLFCFIMALLVWLRGYLVTWYSSFSSSCGETPKVLGILRLASFFAFLERLRDTLFSGYWVYFGILPFDSFWLLWTDSEGFWYTVQFNLLGIFRVL